MTTEHGFSDYYDNSNTVTVSSNSSAPSVAQEAENMLLKGHDEVHLLATGHSAVGTAVNARNILMRNQQFDDLEDDLPFEIQSDTQVGQSRDEHDDEDKDWFYYTEILVTVSKVEDSE